MEKWSKNRMNNLRNIKTYEGFLDFFKTRKSALDKKKVYDTVSLSQIRDCLYDITDEDRIKNSIDYDLNIGFVKDDICFGKKRGLSNNIDHEEFMDDMLGAYDNEFNFEIWRNIILFRISYDPNQISDDDVSEILKNCKSNLESFDCEMSYFLGFDSLSKDDYTLSDISYLKKYCGQEYENFDQMIKGIYKTPHSKSKRNITIKIKVLGEIKK